MVARDSKVVAIRPLPQDVGTRMDAVEKKRLDWLSRGRLAYGKITICDGDPGLGKSTMLMDMAASISRGRPFAIGDSKPKKTGVIIICLEDDPSDTIRPRLEVAGADLKRIWLIDEIPILDDAGNVVPDKTRLFELPGDVKLLEDRCRSWDVGLVIIDPLIGFMEEGLNDNSARDTRKALQPLLKAMQRTETCCVLLRHLNKSQSTNSLHRGAGSVQIGAVARLVMLVANHPEEPGRRVLAMTKSNLGSDVPSLVFSLDSVPDEDVAKVTWHGTVEMTSDELLNNALLTEEQKAENDDAAALLLAILANGPRSETSLTREFRSQGLSANAFKKARSRMRNLNKVKCTRVGGQGETDAVWLWHLPNTNPYETISPNPETLGSQVRTSSQLDLINRNDAELRKYGSE